MDERTTPEPITSRASYYIEPVDETALADVVATDTAVVLVLLTVVVTPIVVVAPSLLVVAVVLISAPLEANVVSCGRSEVNSSPLRT